ncbi:ATP synthase subunit epsilon [Mycoplasmopsis maculosa]|uniref:ATP synthase epsilon chain n=1 Tax=Mycoplasmopsis maculosa TaxID=114885 RepID=A0A449B3M8_9BACT|nr:F0F1 ATP synthase subunit epsilon [Mycoplasmopsis maculosa]VEU75148.1 ATP synthase subunit epsilon [Mycoplasmopsis maculosa]
MNKFSNLKIITQYHNFYTGKISNISLSTKSGGRIIIEPNRSEFLSTIDICELIINEYETNKKILCSISDGIVYADKSEILIVTNDIIFSDQIDIVKAQRDKEYALSQLQKPLSENEEKMFEIKLKKVINRINVSQDKQ